MSSLKLLYVTVPDNNTAKKLASHLLDQKLIACANIFSPHTSIYDWEGKRCEETEIVMILKTQEKLVDSTMAEIVQMHPYDTPCVIVFDSEKTHEQFHQWVKKQVE